MNRTGREPLFSIAFDVIFALGASLIESVLADEWVRSLPWVPDHILLSCVIGGVVVIGLIFAQIGVQNKIESHSRLNSLREYRWRLWLGYLQLGLEVASALASLATGLLLNDLVPFLAGLARAIHTYDPWSSKALFVLLVIFAIVGLVVKRLANPWRLKDAQRFLLKLREQYNDHLNHPLIASHWFALGVEMATNALPSSPEPVRIDLKDTTANPGANIITRELVWRVFNASQQRLLILGEPGGGKSTQLYVLGRALADAPNGEARLPVILDLSTCPADNRPLENWLTDSIVRVYGVGRKAARKWVNNGQVLPLLDSLDTLGREHRRRCVDKLNAYLTNQDFPDRPLIVCCNISEYRTLRTLKLEVRGAIWLRRLTRKQVFRQLDAVAQANQPVPTANDPGNPEIVDHVMALRRDVESHADALTTLRTPLLLSLALMNLDSPHTSQVAFTTATGVQERRRMVFRRYVEIMMKLPALAHPQEHAPTREEVGGMERGLSWVGHALRLQKARMHGAEIFFLKNLQRESLSSNDAVRRYEDGLRRVRFGIRFTIGPLLGLAAGIILALIYAAGGGDVFKSYTPTPLTYPGWMPWTFFPVTGLIGGVGVGYGIEDTIDSQRDIELPERPRGSRLSETQSLLIAVPGVVLASLAIGLLVGGLWGTIVGLVSGATVAIIVGAVAGALIWAGRDADNPNVQVLYAAKVTLRTLGLNTLAGLVVGEVVVGLPLFLALSLGSSNIRKAPAAGFHAVLVDAAIGAGLGAGIGAIIGLSIALGRGGAAWLQHMMLRLELKRSGAIPYSIVRFLNTATVHHLLRREGSGYCFIVRSEMLRDYFADEYARYNGHRPASSSSATSSLKKKRGKSRYALDESHPNLLMRILTRAARFLRDPVPERNGQPTNSAGDPP